MESILLKISELGHSVASGVTSVRLSKAPEPDASPAGSRREWHGPWKSQRLQNVLEPTRDLGANKPLSALKGP